MAWFDLDDKEFSELLRLSRLYHREAIRCEDSKAYLAGCAMAGASLEALLLAMVHMYGDEVEAAGFVAKTGKNQAKELRRWTLSELLQTAAGMHWLPAAIQTQEKWSGRRAKIGDYAKELMKTRNLIHPGRYLRDHSPSRVTQKYLTGSIEVLDAAHEQLQAKVHESLARKMAEMDHTSEETTGNKDAS